MLLIDEVYVKPTLQYHGGTLFGKASNKPSLLANTLLTFMVVSLCGGPKFACKMLPIKQLDAEFLFLQAQQLLSGIKSAGGNTVAIICDGNRVNQSFFKMFSTKPEKPWKTSDDIFLLFDYVHLVKSVRNNWITEKTQELLFVKSGKTCVAKWSHLKELERQKVATCLQVFCDKTVSVVKTHSYLIGRNVNDTALFLELFVAFWKVVNVHGPYEDICLNDDRRSVIRLPSNANLHQLLTLGDLAKSMAPVTTPRIKSLSRDTSRNLAHTCYGLVDVAKNLLNHEFDYVPFGHFTTDPLEKEFSKLRKGSGRAYFISVQQALSKVEIH